MEKLNKEKPVPNVLNNVTSNNHNLNQITTDTQLDKKKYDIVFIGGGPSTLGFISYIFQKRLQDKVFGDLNILIVEREGNFGSGCLGKYGINTNTSSEGFPRLICTAEGGVKGKTGKFALSPSKNNMKLSKNYKKENQKKEKPNEEDNEESKQGKQSKSKLIIKRIPLFYELFESEAVQSLLSIGNRPAPLSLVGHFLDCLGNFIIHFVKEKYDKNILMNKAEVKSIKVYNNEEFGICLKKVDDVNSNQTSLNLIKTKCLIMCTGGKQSIENDYYQKIVSLKGQERVLSSDYVLRKEGYSHLSKILSQNSETKKKIVIIGGSHSGFSSAWIILNGPSTYDKIISGGKPYEAKYNINCDKCDKSSKCVCYGEIPVRNWNFVEENTNPHGNIQINPDNVEITILYRDNIKVYYPSEEEASAENYTCYNPKYACNKQGRVYPFIGIRGDAKELYNKIQTKQETRVKLVKTDTNKSQTNYIKEADVVIWACGYVTNNIPFLDARNQPVDFFLDDLGSFEVDKELHLISKNRTSFKNLYGIGQGYSTKTPEIINGKKARADSIHIYNTYIADKLYRSLSSFVNKTSLENSSKQNSQITKAALFNKRNSENTISRRNGSMGREEEMKSNKMPKKNNLFNAIGKNVISNNGGVGYKNSSLPFNTVNKAFDQNLTHRNKYTNENLMLETINEQNNKIQNLTNFAPKRLINNVLKEKPLNNILTYRNDSKSRSNK